MKKILYKAEERGKGNYDWLLSRHSFSFANWYDASRMGFGSLRVLNDDIIAPDTGFSMHEHQDMEIITIVTSGTLTHRDSMGNKGTVCVGEVQVMSAGTGVAHSEYNDSKEEPLALFQIWIEPKTTGTEPRYDQKALTQSTDSSLLLVSPDTRMGSLCIGQDAFITRIQLSEKPNTTYTSYVAENGLYVFVIHGTVEIDGTVLNPRDSMGITEAGVIRLDARGMADVLVIEVPVLKAT